MTKLGKHQKAAMNYLAKFHHRAFADLSGDLKKGAEALCARNLAEQDVRFTGYRLTADGRLRHAQETSTER